LFRKLEGARQGIDENDFMEVFLEFKRNKNWSHERMAEHYVETIAERMSQFDAFAEGNMQIYDDLAWVGLWKVRDKNNTGSFIETKAWQRLGSEEQKRIKTEIRRYQKRNENVKCQ
jgi:hypothetical protein